VVLDARRRQQGIEGERAIKQKRASSAGTKDDAMGSICSETNGIVLSLPSPFIVSLSTSLASQGINLSEDIFAGYNGVIRGGVVGFKEYVQVGKGRDVGAAQIFKFESKLAQGNAEQSLSRDVYRLCHRLDFGKLLSMFWGGIGFYIGCVLTISTVYLVTYLMLGLALFDCEKIGDRTITPMGGIQVSERRHTQNRHIANKSFERSYLIIRA